MFALSIKDFEVKSDNIEMICKYSQRDVCVMLEDCVCLQFMKNCIYFNLESQWYKVRVKVFYTLMTTL